MYRIARVASLAADLSRVAPTIRRPIARRRRARTANTRKPRSKLDSATRRRSAPRLRQLVSLSPTSPRRRRASRDFGTCVAIDGTGFFFFFFHDGRRWFERTGEGIALVDAVRLALLGLRRQFLSTPKCSGRCPVLEVSRPVIVSAAVVAVVVAMIGNNIRSVIF